MTLLGRYLLLSAFCLTYLAPISIQHFITSFDLTWILIYNKGRCLLQSGFSLTYLVGTSIQHLVTSFVLTTILIFNLVTLLAINLASVLLISIQHFVASFNLSLIGRNLYGMETSYLKFIGYPYVPHPDQTMIFLLSSYCYLKLKLRKIVNAPPLWGVGYIGVSNKL